MNYKDYTEDFQYTIETVDVDLKVLGTVKVKQYLPIEEKVELINYVIKASLDGSTNSFSPVRTSVYFDLATLKYYADIETDIEDGPKAYDAYCMYDIFTMVQKAIPKSELDFLIKMVTETVADIEKYNYSAVGLINSMGKDADSLSESMKEIFEEIKDNKEVMRLMGEIN